MPVTPQKDQMENDSVDPPRLAQFFSNNLLVFALLINYARF